MSQPFCCLLLILLSLDFLGQPAELAVLVRDLMIFSGFAWCARYDLGHWIPTFLLITTDPAYTGQLRVQKGSSCIPTLVW